MKTPDEIKKGLEMHYTAGRCKECPYTTDSAFKKTCFQLVAADALAYIQQLESSYNQVSKALCGKENATTDELLRAVSQVKNRLAKGGLLIRI